MQVVRYHRVVYVDVDGTLIDYDLSSFPKEAQITVSFVNGPVDVVPNQKNINVVQKFKKLGYGVVVWSHSGADWAEAVVTALGLEPFVDFCFSKGNFYIDDLPAEKFMGTRVWRNPITGKSDEN